MTTFRYIFAVLIVISLPPALIAWYYIHPFVSFWRKLGPVVSVTVMVAQILLGMVLLFSMRGFLVGTDLGTHPVPLSLAAIFMVATIGLALARRKHLTMRILSGVPEFQADGKGGELLTEGIYSRIRHPRYLEVILGTLAYALFSNYSGAYVMALLTVPLVHGIVLLEERELRDRFGDAYVEYAARVPRYVPKRQHT